MKCSSMSVVVFIIGLSSSRTKGVMQIPSGRSAKDQPAHRLPVKR